MCCGLGTWLARRQRLLVSRSNGGSRRFFTLDNHPFSIRLEGFIGVTDGFRRWRGGGE